MLLGVFKTVFKNKLYLALSLSIAFILIVFSTWLPNIELIFTVLKSQSATFLEKVNIIYSLTGSITTNFTLVSASSTFLIAILFGINTAMFVFFLKKRKALLKSSGITSLGGLISGLFGIGCATCGTLLLGPLLSFIGAGWIVAYLPFAGQEFGILGVIILFFSIFLTAKKINKPNVCEK